jgi:ABC-type multidrug transport system ATPase subunit
MKLDPRSLESLNTEQLFESQPNVKRAPKKSSRFFVHFKAIMFRRIILFKRTWKTTVSSMLATVFFTSLAIFAQYLIESLITEENKQITFKTFKSTNNIPLVGSSETLANNSDIISIIRSIYVNDTGEEPNFLNFSTRQEMNAYIYKNQETKTGIQSFPVGFNFEDSPDDIILVFNGTVPFSASNATQPLYTEAILGRIMVQHQLGGEFTISFVTLMKKTLEKIFSVIGPMLISGGMLSTLPILISQPITDISGEVRPYMISCTLTILPYWAATFLLDLIIYVIIATMVWGMFLIFHIQAFLDNIFIMWYVFAMSGPGYIIFLYCLSFFFDSPETASRDLFIILAIIYLIPVFTDLINDYEPNPLWYDWLMASVPHMQFQRAGMFVLNKMGFLVKPFSWYWDDENSRAFFIMQIVNIPIYSIILILIEKIRIIKHVKDAKHQYTGYTDFFAEEKKKHPVSCEAIEMEENVKNNTNFAVRINNCSRLFFNTKGEPVAAVNGVSLGIKENSIFGFLGANGAGKTTLIKMITSMLPPSDGTIEINGVNIQEYNDPTLLSICPQFNNHLCFEMTPNEHFRLYTMIHNLDKDDAKAQIDKLLASLEMTHFADTPLQELSGGDQRKVAIALSFFGTAKIILLDEPTASLDPVARHNVHEMILSYKGQKTFMLCTHLLSEAEFLCDMISIMVKGCVYTCGTSEYLTHKFGTDYKIDVMVADEREETEQSVTNFFRENLPAAKLQIRRPGARIYSIPATDRPLSQLFKIMQEGEDSNIGITYFTCSSSSLERVFMEIVHMSENQDFMLVGHKP